MKLSWADLAWDDYLYWQKTNKAILKRINMLIKEIKREPYSGVGSPEPLKHNLSDCLSRRINREHRLVYMVLENEIVIIQCRLHY